MRASLAYRCFITAVEVLLVTFVIGALTWLLHVLHAPRGLYAPLSTVSYVIGFLAAGTAAVSAVVLGVIGRRWGGGGGTNVSGQMEFTLMVFDDLRHPLTWPSRPYERW
jgi:hypothetical protein